MEQNNQDDGIGCCCCAPMVEESETLKKLKPVLIGGIVIYSILLFLDLIYLGNMLLMDYALIILCLTLMTVNRCYLAFHYYTFLSILLVFSYIFPKCGIIIQLGFPNSKAIIEFCIQLFTIIFSVLIFYFGFDAYKEMKYLFINKIVSNPQLAGFTSGYPQVENNYSTNSNNNNSKQSKSNFKAFSGKGYRVGGS